MSRFLALAAAAVLTTACESKPSTTIDGEDSVGGGGGSAQAGGGQNTGGVGASTASGGSTTSEVRYHPPPGFESCVHAEVKEACEGGWCKLPPSCFVMGSPENEWHRGRDSENQTAVTLTHPIEMQQEELTRAEWEQVTDTPAPGPDLCAEAQCPVAMVSWWDAVHTANMLSEQDSLDHCYEPIGCTGTLGKDLTCTGVADPDKSVYECEGYRLPTRAEAEYAARAGTSSTWYSGDITVYSPDTECQEDPALELIAWYCNNSEDRPHVGGELRPNDFGLFDMIGNLGEWSSEPQLGQSSPGGEDPRGAVGTTRNRLRFGGQFNLYNFLVRTAGLTSGPWEGRAHQLGFRLVRTLPD